jgi:hypothetical protein
MMLERFAANFLSGYLSICAVVALVAAILLSRRAWRLGAGHRAIGMITGYRQRTRARRTSAHHFMPVFRFEAGGRSREVQSRVGTRRPDRLPPGSAVAVRYDPANPELAEIDTPGRAWLGPAAFVVLAAGTLVAAWKAGG